MRHKTTFWGAILACFIMAISITAYPTTYAKPAGSGPVSAIEYTPTIIDNEVKNEVKEDTDHHRRQHRARKHMAILKDTAQLLGMTDQELMNEWRQGKSLEQIAKEKKKWNSAVLVRKLTVIQSSKIDNAVKDGKMTQEQAERLKKKLPDSLKRMVQHSHKSHPHNRMQPDPNNQI